MNNKDKFLNNIRNSLQHSFLPDGGPEHPGSFQGYSFQADAPTEQLVEQFKQELETLSGHVYITQSIEETASKILEILEKHQTKRILAWDDSALELPGLSQALTEAGVTIAGEVLSTGGEARKKQMAGIDDVQVGLTGAHGGLADTGAVALISGPGRGRLASLLPPVHIALLKKSRLYPSLPLFLADNPAAATAGSNLVFIAGPSRTGDIEMTLSMGVHGPGEVHVVIVP